MKQFLLTYKVDSIPNWLSKSDFFTKEGRMDHIHDEYGFKRLKGIILNEEEREVGVIIEGDIKKIGAFLVDPECMAMRHEMGVIPETIRTDVYGAHAIRLRILSEMESSIARVLVNESSEEEEIILAGGEDGKIQPEICYR